MAEKYHMEYLSNDHITLIHAVKWIPEGEIKAILQISHGMVEHIERYDDFASYLAEHQIMVVGNDHLGHGRSIRSEEDYGFFAEKDGNSIVIKDLHRLRKMIQEEYPKVPYFMLGHSMGSFFAREYICHYGKGLSGAMILGTGDLPQFFLKFARGIVKLLAHAKGWRYRSQTIAKGMHLYFHRKIAEKKDCLEWLTKDQTIREQYRKDERCQFIFTLNAYHVMLFALNKLSGDACLQKMPKNLPILFAAGVEDALGNYGKGVLQLYSRFKELGMKNVQCKLYMGDRHEIINELDRQKVYEDLFGWMTECLKNQERQEEQGE